MLQLIQQTRNNKEFVRFFKFSVVGAIGFVVDFGLLSLLHLAFDMPELLANVFSFTAAVISNFIWNRLWVYPDSRSKSLREQFALFFVINLAGLGINTLVFGLSLPHGHLVLELITWLTRLPISPELDYIPPKMLATVVVLFWNFFVNRYWTFNDVE